MTLTKFIKLLFPRKDIDAYLRAMNEPSPILGLARRRKRKVKR